MVPEVVEGLRRLWSDWDKLSRKPIDQEVGNSILDLRVENVFLALIYLPHNMDRVHYGCL